MVAGSAAEVLPVSLNVGGWVLRSGRGQYNGTLYKCDFLHYRKLNILNLRIDLRFRHQAVWRETHGQDPCSC
jgi:hypothetical protein